MKIIKIMILGMIFIKIMIKIINIRRKNKNKLNKLNKYKIIIKKIKIYRFFILII